jgi:hypothetical protein
MAQQDRPPAGTAGEGQGGAFSAAPWAVLVLVLVLGGLALSSRAGDAYTALAGLLFAGFGAFIGFRLLDRMLP